MENKTAEEYLKQWHIQDVTIVLLDNKRESFGRIRKAPKEIKLSELLSDYSRNTEQQLAEKDKEIEMLKKSLEGLLDGVDTFCKTIPAQMTSEAIYLWEKRTESYESLNK